MQQNTVFPSLERILRLQDAHALTKRSDLCRVRAAGMMRPGMCEVFELGAKPTERSARSELKTRSCVHWLGSSAKRAFGECLGDKRR